MYSEYQIFSLVGTINQLCVQTGNGIERAADGQGIVVIIYRDAARWRYYHPTISNLDCLDKWDAAALRVYSPITFFCFFFFVFNSLISLFHLFISLITYLYLLLLRYFEMGTSRVFVLIFQSFFKSGMTWFLISFSIVIYLIVFEFLAIVKVSKRLEWCVRSFTRIFFSEFRQSFVLVSL